MLLQGEGGGERGGALAGEAIAAEKTKNSFRVLKCKLVQRMKQTKEE